MIELIKLKAEEALTAAIIGTDEYRAGEYITALDYYLYADKLIQNATLKAKIADSYYAIGEYKKTVEYEIKAMEISPDWSGPPYMLALAYWQLGEIQEAKEAAKLSCELGFTGGCEVLEQLKNIN